ncbi:ribosome small subunit-dependent GTPase A [bacterium]|jgi:ribosome biogenesis GTPase / thiamine phosphate phosphatase|nr:ribosome small subunit-dependent GTPase A [bacterium]
MSDLTAFGLDPYFDDLYQKNENKEYILARVIREDMIAYLVQTKESVVFAELTGSLGFKSTSVERPKVGDWVLGTQKNKDLFVIHETLTRKNKISRKASGKRTEEQILAANVDLVFVVIGLDHDFNINRLERYLSLGKQQGARTIVVLNKVDICKNADDLKNEILNAENNQDVVMISAIHNMGVEQISELFKPNKTGILVGSSGVGKSTLVNSLLGRNAQETKSVRESDSKGMHTTSFRQLFLLPDGGCLVDTPGMRELTLWEDADQLSDSHNDIVELGLTCKFRNCSHTVEKGCSILDAISNNSLDKKRYDNYVKLQDELERLRVQKSQKAKLDVKKNQKKLMKSYEESINFKKRNR